MYHDAEACTQVDNMCVVWGTLLDSNLAQYADQMGAQHGLKASISYRSEGAFNRCYEVQFEDKFTTIFRFPMLGKIAFRKEKVIDEVTVMDYVAEHTSIPTPKILRLTESPWGPCIVMEVIEGNLLSDFLKAPREPGKVDVLDPNINAQTLSKAYRTMSKILLDLSKCQFPSIGGLCRDRRGHWRIGKRPMTMNTNQLVALANYPPADLPAHTFATATDYFTALAENHMTNLRTQRNDAVVNEADCRNKYVARCLFLQIARLFSRARDRGPFGLVCDGLRPSNVIVDDELNLRCVPDWEFSYAAPVEFTYCSPWWLLLVHPDDWEGSLDSFLAQYLPRHETFLQALKEVEDDAIRDGALSESQRLSGEMARSMQNGRFWFCLAATSTFSFDEIYWRFMDSAYFGEFTSIEQRIRLLDRAEQDSLEDFVRVKMQQARERTLDEHRTFDEILAS